VPFYEAYFSNYIEGSTLTVDEAKRVVLDDADGGKPEDAHDIRSTWVTSSEEMLQSFGTPDEFMDALRDHHRVMMAAHPDTLPDLWKTDHNRRVPLARISGPMPSRHQRNCRCWRRRNRGNSPTDTAGR